VRTKAFVVVTGLPGVGKSSLARVIASELGLVALELDRMEAPLFRQGISGDSIGWSAYEALTALAEDNLRLGYGVLLDSVGWTRELRTRWATLAQANGMPYRPIEVVCSDLTLHRARVESRNSATRSGWANPDWESVAARRSLYEAWDRPRLVLDSVRRLEELVAEAIHYVRL
jgi:predicted kinase